MFNDKAAILRKNLTSFLGKRNSGQQKVFKVGNFLAAQKFIIGNTFVKYEAADGWHTTVQKSAIKAIAITPHEKNEWYLLILGGAGNDLAQITLPRIWAEGAMLWLITELKLT